MSVLFTLPGYLLIRVVPPPNGRGNKSYSAYIKAQLFHASQDQEWRSKTVHVTDVPGDGADVMWDEKFEWEFDADDLAFLRYGSVLSYTMM